ncbi:MAG: hypothetical protein OXH15_18420 [Gammaproteobacteria bacterium]|nr:hypothetical protein [Gammaproteobacteria bacterium]
MNRKQFDKTERRPVSKANFLDALRQILTTDQPEPRKSENREPTTEELNKRWRLDRRDGKPVG